MTVRSSGHAHSCQALMPIRISKVCKLTSRHSPTSGAQSKDGSTSPRCSRRNLPPACGRPSRARLLALLGALPIALLFSLQESWLRHAVARGWSCVGVMTDPRPGVNGRKTRRLHRRGTVIRGKAKRIAGANEDRPGMSRTELLAWPCARHRWELALAKRSPNRSPEATRREVGWTLSPSSSGGSMAPRSDGRCCRTSQRPASSICLAERIFP